MKIRTSGNFRRSMNWLVSQGIMSENIEMCKIARFCLVLCVILTTSVRNSYLLTKYKVIDAKIAHFM